MDLQAFQLQFNPFFHEILKEKLAVYQGFTHDPLQPVYIDQLLKLAAGGKRIRPYLCSVMAHVDQHTSVPNSVLRVAAALELFHLFALVHDDIIDRSDTRHATPTMHAFIERKLTQHDRLGDRAHIGTSLALLWGDILLTLVHELIYDARSTFDSTVLDSVRALLFTMTHEVVAGQMIDVSIPTLNNVDEALLHQKNLLKTARYTFVRPMQIGACLHNADESVLEFCSCFGEVVGTAFQIQDDLLDVMGDEAATGKPILSDILDRQHTVLTQYVMQHGSLKQKKVLEQAFGATSFTSEEKIAIKRVFIESGAVDYAQKIVQDSYSLALKQLADSPLSASCNTSLASLLSLLTARIV